MTLEGKQLGRYQIVRLLGSGGMSEVWLAEDPRIRQQVALKVIRSERSPSLNTPAAHEAARLFQREASAIGQLDHPHILPLYDYGEALVEGQTLIYLVMPYRPEGSLANWVEQRFPDRLVPPGVVAHILRQAAQAIQHAHDQLIIHQDVKPSNFLLRERKEAPGHPDVLLADFGIARLATATTSVSQSIRGTPAYMAPEQCVGEAVPASDQYALAVMAYELLTGRPPFQGNVLRIMYQQVHTPPEPPGTHHPRLSSAVSEVILTALAKRPEERFRSVTAFATAFWNAVQGMELAEALTRISTPLLPAAPLISETLAHAPTRIIPPATAATLAQPTSSAPPTPALAPVAQTIQLRGAITPEPTALPQTSTLGQQQGSDTLVLPPPAPAPLGPSDAESHLASGGGKASSGSGALPVPTRSGPLSAGLRRGGQRRLPLIAAVLVVLALLAGGLAYVLLGMGATVTITPTSKAVQGSYPLTAVTGTPDASKQQVGARMVFATTLAQMSTVNTIGQGPIRGTGAYATGVVEIDNNSSTNLTFAVGQSFPNNANVGGCNDILPIHLVLDQSITAHAHYDANFAYAHVQEIGTIGNSPGSTPQGCRFFEYGSGNPSYFIFNTAAFSGGVDPQIGRIIQQSDIDTAANSLIAATQPDPEQVLRSQLQPNEHLADTAHCTPNISTDHQAGDAGTAVTVSVSFTCTGLAYDHDGAVALLTKLLQAQAATDPGAAYALAGKLRVVLLSTTPTPGVPEDTTLTFFSEGIFASQFSPSQQHMLAQLIAG